MKYVLFIASIIFTLFACNSKKVEHTLPINKTIASQKNDSDSVVNIFPVTSFLKGEIFSIKNGGTTPIRKITINKKTDSSWVKMEDLETLCAEFLNPTIDSASLKNSFVEKRFLDQTINAFTFTYDPANAATNSFPFLHWDVYVNPETEKVNRIYLVKKKNETTTLQLTWQAGKWYKIITLITTNGNTIIAKEETITWRF